MRRRGFIGLVLGGTVLVTAGTGYRLSDKKNRSGADLNPNHEKPETLQPDEAEILFLASLAPSGHNTQPWFVDYLGPFPSPVSLRRPVAWFLRKPETRA